tara:strand:- start:350 stop:559 length:210 start_codon:yes stop_codon:yes gene_type:complete
LQIILPRKHILGIQVTVLRILAIPMCLRVVAELSTVCDLAMDAVDFGAGQNTDFSAEIYLTVVLISKRG